MKQYFINLLIAIDQLGNTLAGGYPDETISLHAARARDRGERWGCVLCKLLDYVVKDHCTNTELSKHISILSRGL
jgi:hypothetical protein